MTRWPLMILLMVLAGLSVLFFPGIVRSQSSVDSKSIRIIYTNDIQGYLEPCGCGGRYEGGFARLGNLLSSLSRERPNCLILDSGNICDSKNKMGFVATLLSTLKYDAIGVGRQDIALEDEFFKQTSDAKLTVLGTVRKDNRSTLPYLIKQVGEVRVGVISYGADIPKNATSQEIADSFIKSYETARQASDILILLDQGGIANQQWIEKNADGLGAPDVVIGGALNSARAVDTLIGKTHVVPTSSQGKRVGVIDVEATGDRQFTITIRTVPSDRNTAEDASIKKLITEFVLKQAESAPQRNLVSGNQVTSTKIEYLSSQTCKKCHAEEYKDWAQSKHSAAIDTLASNNRLIPECLGCHSEQFRQTQKISLRASTKDPSGVVCASCHISVLPHGANGPPKGSSAKVDPKLCLDCHNTERSPNYNEKSYLSTVSHKDATGN